MDVWQAVFNWPLPFFGFRLISVVAYFLWFTIAWLKLRKSGLPLRRRFKSSFFFMVFIVLVSDWIWTFAQNTRWRSYIPGTNEGAWISLQPWPLGPIFRDVTRVPLYLLGTVMAAVSLLPLFRERIMRFNRMVFLTYGIYLSYWLLLVWFSPSPLYGDIGLWTCWPSLAAETGQGVFWLTVLLADVISRFVLIGPCALSWWKKCA